MIRPAKKSFAWFVLLTLVACVPQPWVMVGGKFTDTEQQFEVELPRGWRKANRVEDALIITKEGVVLQMIVIKRTAIDESLLYTKKKISHTMLPQEVAEVVVDNIRANPNITKQHIAENAPDTLDENLGYRLVYGYENQGGLRVKGVKSGFILKKWHYTITYEAPSRYYFSKYQSVFEEVKKSFRIAGEIS